MAIEDYSDSAVDAMPKVKRERGDSVITSRAWVAADQHFMQNAATDESHPLHLRVYFAAIGWANNASAAEFKRGGLMAALGSDDRQGVYRAVKRAVGLGLLDQGSTTTRLLLPVEGFQRASRKAPGSAPADAVGGALPAALESTAEAYWKHLERHPDGRSMPLAM